MARSEHSILRRLWQQKWAIVSYWDFLAGLLIGLALWANEYVYRVAPSTDSLRAEILKAGPTVGVLGLSLAAANLTFLSSTRRSTLMMAGAKSGALQSFATFSWWEGMVAMPALVASLLARTTWQPLEYVAIGLVLYAVAGILGLLDRLTHIVYRHADDLRDSGAKDNPEENVPEARGTPRTRLRESEPVGTRRHGRSSKTTYK